MTTDLDTPSVLRSTYQSELTTASDKYSRDQCLSSDYHYEALQFDTPSSGVYRFQSESTVYLYGYLYRDTFNPFDANRNRLLENDATCGTGELLLNSFLLSNTTYILVVTTDIPRRTGAFMIQVFGAANITFSRIGEFVEYSLKVYQCIISHGDICSPDRQKLFFWR